MKILTDSRAFLPMVGGLELTIADLAARWIELGHEVVVLTRTPGEHGELYRVVRRPPRTMLLRLVRWCDVFHQANVSLRGLWPLLFVRRPWVVSHHTFYRRPDWTIGWQDLLKCRLSRYAAASIAVSSAVAADLPGPSTVIGNPYRDDLFRELAHVPRERDLVFVGRLVQEKGADLLLDAMALLASEGLRPGLTVVGDGPERTALEAQTHRIGVAGQVVFTGTLRHETLVKMLNRHRVLVVPSRHEAFGVVALEGIACGCAVVVSDADGLPAAVGKCGVTFPSGNVASLARAIGQLLGDPGRRQSLLESAPEHLDRRTSRVVAARYLEAFEAALRRNPC